MCDLSCHSLSFFSCIEGPHGCWKVVSFLLAFCLLLVLFFQMLHLWRSVLLYNKLPFVLCSVLLHFRSSAPIPAKLCVHCFSEAIPEKRYVVVQPSTWWCVHLSRLVKSTEEYSSQCPTWIWQWKHQIEIQLSPMLVAVYVQQSTSMRRALCWPKYIWSTPFIACDLFHWGMFL